MKLETLLLLARPATWRTQGRNITTNQTPRSNYVNRGNPPKPKDISELLAKQVLFDDIITSLCQVARTRTMDFFYEKALLNRNCSKVRRRNKRTAGAGAVYVRPFRRWNSDVWEHSAVPIAFVLWFRYSDWLLPAIPRTIEKLSDIFSCVLFSVPFFKIVITKYNSKSLNSQKQEHKQHDPQTVIICVRKRISGVSWATLSCTVATTNLYTSIIIRGRPDDSDKGSIVSCCELSQLSSEIFGTRAPCWERGRSQPLLRFLWNKEPNRRRNEPNESSCCILEIRSS